MLDPEDAQNISVDRKKLRSLQRLWDEVSVCPVWDATSALRLFLQGLCDILEATDATWMIMRKHPKLPREISTEHSETIFESMQGWAPVVAEYLNPKKSLKNVAERWLLNAREDGIDPLTQFMLGGFGEYTSACIRHDVATDEEWEDHWFPNNHLKMYGVGERLVASTPMNSKCDSLILIDRPINAAPYTTEECDFVKFAIASVPSLHKRLCLERGLLASSAMLSNREMDTYRLLLTDLSKSEIAEKLNLSTHTIHDYTGQLYRKFGVKGRIGLMAMALGS